MSESGEVVIDMFGNAEGYASNPGDPPACPRCAEMERWKAKAERLEHLLAVANVDLANALLKASTPRPR